MLTPDQTIDQRYRVVRELGQGAFGVTHLAEDLHTHRLVVLKIALLDEEGSAARLQKEAQALAQLHHPNIARVLSSGRLPAGRPYLVLEYVAGSSLKTVLAAHSLPLQPALEVLHAVAVALSAVHAAGLIHRDLKPSNVIIPQREGNLDFAGAKLVDFGVLGELMQDAALKQNVTMAGQFFGTPYYMSPEQLRAQPQSPATDIYGMGVLFYEMLFGEPPFHTDSVAEFLLKALREEITLPAAPSVPEGVRTWLVRALQKDPSRRPQTAAEALAELEVLLQPRASRLDRSSPPARRGLEEERGESSGTAYQPAPLPPPRAAVEPAAVKPAKRPWWMIILPLTLLAILIWLVGSGRFLGIFRKLSNFSGIWAGMLFIFGGVILGLLLPRLLRHRRTQIEQEAGRLLLGTQGAMDLSASLAVQVDDLIAKCQRIDEKILGLSIAQLLGEYQSAQASSERQAALMNVAQLLEKLMPRLSPWYIRHEKLLAGLISMIGIVSGIVSIVASVVKLVHGKPVP